LIWIKGKAGTGKSTILKFAAERGHIPEDDELVLMHFFNGRGT
jgi:dephospho-CoA kinase